MRARATLSALIVGALWTPAFATGGVYCDSPGNPDVAAMLTVGRVPGFAVVGAVISAGGRTWDMNGLNGDPVALAQAADDHGRITVDVTDPNAERIIASLRLVATSTEDGQAAGGTLSVPGIGVWPMICELE